jgi:hypothetical protein
MCHPGLDPAVMCAATTGPRLIPATDSTASLEPEGARGIVHGRLETGLARWVARGFLHALGGEVWAVVMLTDQ